MKFLRTYFYVGKMTVFYGNLTKFGPWEIFFCSNNKKGSGNNYSVEAYLPLNILFLPNISGLCYRSDISAVFLNFYDCSSRIVQSYTLIL